MKQVQLLFLSLILVSSAGAQDLVQKQRLSLVASQFMNLYNTGDTNQYKAFLDEKVKDPVQRNNWFMGYKNAFNVIGKVNVKQVKFLSPEQAIICARDQRYDSWWEFAIYTDSAQQFQRRTVRPIPFPGDFLGKGKLPVKQLCAEVDDYITHKLSGDFTGNVFIAKGNEVLFSKSYGNNALGKPNSFDQDFGLASMGKMFTAVRILQLMDQHLLALDDQVRKYLPDLKNQAVAGITIAQLLTHTSGMGDFFESPLYERMKDSLKKSTDFIPLIEDDHLSFEPGKDWRYSNTGFMLLGIIIEKLTGETYASNISKNIFQPLGMNHSVPGDGAGGGTSTVHDLFLFAQGLKAGKVLQQSTTSKILSYTVNGQYGYGTEHQQLGEEHIVGHSGGFINVCTELNIYTRSNYTVIILSNSNPPYGHFLSNKIKEYLVRK